MIDGITIKNPIFSMILHPVAKTVAMKKFSIRIFPMKYFKSPVFFGDMTLINSEEEITKDRHKDN